MKTAVRCGWPALLPTYPSSGALTATGCPSGEWLTGKDSSGTGRRQPSLTGADMYTFAVAGISRTPALSMSGDMACPAAAAIANLSIMNTAPAVGRRSWPSLELLRNTPEFSRELPASAGELNNPVSQSWRGLALQLTRRPGQRGQHYAPPGSFLGRLDQEFPQRNIDVNIVEFEVEGGLHVGGADDARRSVVLASLPPQFFAFDEGHLDPAVAAGNGAFDRDFARECRHIHRHSRESGNPKAIGSKCVFASYRIPGSRFRGDDGNRRLETDILKLTTLPRHSPNITRTAQGRGFGHARTVCSVNFTSAVYTPPITRRESIENSSMAI